MDLNLKCSISNIKMNDSFFNDESEMNWIIQSCVLNIVFQRIENLNIKIINHSTLWKNLLVKTISEFEYTVSHFVYRYRKDKSLFSSFYLSKELHEFLFWRVVRHTFVKYNSLFYNSIKSSSILFILNIKMGNKILLVL